VAALVLLLPELLLLLKGSDEGKTANPLKVLQLHQTLGIDRRTPRRVQSFSQANKFFA
jgi:hypothetical protein